MEITDTVILKLEKLARLSLDPEARQGMRADLQKMLDMVDKLQSLNTEGVKPMVYLNDTYCPPASDIAIVPLDRETVLKNAPEHDGTYFLVPKVIQTEQ
jgi:aspartyl-tRNA(Asn)/glutamyl-tRNA(Gln) amidotransferase subunit C